jgi:hypothetical protein
MSKKVKIPGYAKREFYGNGIEYRPYTEALTGDQTSVNPANTIFTLNGFVITTNFDPKPDKTFITSKYSKFSTLEDLGVDVETNQALFNKNNKTKLNLDPTKISNFAYFGSAKEFIRVSLEDIIMRFPASLYINTIDKISNQNTGYTVENYTYDSLLNTSKFKINVNYIFNTFNLIYLSSGEIISNFTTINDLKNLSTNYNDYIISNENGDFTVIGFTGSTSQYNDYIYLEVNGDSFPDGVSALSKEYHIKPNENKQELFYNSLDTFQNNLLNRLSYPKYKSTFRYSIKNESGVIIKTQQNLIWPTTDGYNIDFDSTKYLTFVGNLVAIAEASDNTNSDLMVRFLTSDSISSFDTTSDDEDETGQKMTKTLRIYGRQFDEIKKYIDGLAFANTVTYDKRDNTPDVTLKNIAYTLGWDLTSSIQDNDLIKNYLTKSESTYSGTSRGLTPYEAEIELWRRLILNSAWLWKSKGTRKGIEFLFNFIGTPDGLITFKEHVYVANKPLDINLVKETLEKITGDSDITNITIDDNGYPKCLKDTPEMYFQKGGLWYRETAGKNSHVDILYGNNPHIGPYDGGNEYINQFRTLVPNFSATTITEEVITTGSTNLFVNYNSGFINNTPLTDPLYVDIQVLDINDNDDQNSFYNLTSTIINDPFPRPDETNCGCEISGDDLALRLDSNLTFADGRNYKRNIILNTDGNDGSTFYVTENQKCNLEIKFDYLISHFCDNILDGVNSTLESINIAIATEEATINSLTIDLNNQYDYLATLTGQTQTPLVIAQIAATEFQILTLTNSINSSQNSLDNQQAILDSFNNMPITSILGNFNLKVLLNKVIPQPGPGIPFTIYDKLAEYTVLDIVDFNEYITNNTNTGILFSGGSCDNLITAIKTELSGNCGIVSGETFNSTWKTFETIISDESILSGITNEKIKISLVVDWTTPYYFAFNGYDKISILLDRIQLNKICTNLEKTNITLTKSPGFELERVVDNKKSWTNESNTRNYDLKYRETNYNVSDERLVINSKELDLDIDGAHAIESNLFSYVDNNINIKIRFDDNGFYSGYTGYVFSSAHGLSKGDVINVVQDAGAVNIFYDGITTIIDVPSTTEIVTDKLWGVSTIANPGYIYPYTVPLLTSDISNLTTVEEFIKIVVSELIDVKTRKVIGSYPTLRQLYDKYLDYVSDGCSTCPESSKYNYVDLKTFSELIGNYWIDLVEQFIPATTIWGSTNVYRNTEFDAQKFKYKKYNTFFGGTLQQPITNVDFVTGITIENNVEIIVTDITNEVTVNNCVVQSLPTQTLSGITICNINYGSEFIGPITIL